MDPKWYHVCWPRLTAKRVNPVVSISWASCWSTYTNCDIIAVCAALYRDMRKNFFLYRCTSTSLALNYCSGILFKSLSCLYEVVRTNLSADFWLFEIFDRNFAKLVAPPSKKNENFVVHLKEQSLLKKTLKPRRNRSINGNAILVRTMHPSNEQRAGLGAWQKTYKQTYKHPVFASTAGARCTIFPKLCTVIELVETIKRY